MTTSPTKLAYHPLVRHTVFGLRQRCGVKEGDGILVAVSGGADSVALLRALALLTKRRTWRLRLHVGHVNHHLRPADQTQDDATFVEALAVDLGLPFHRRDIEVLPGNVESQARKQRYAALAAMARDAELPYIATAHHADDQLETVLMRLLRGTTAKGLRGIAWRRPVAKAEKRKSGKAEDQTSEIEHRRSPSIIRPMLASTHAEAIDFLEQLGQPWREDPTNTDRSRTRARLRHEVLPVLRDLRPSVARKVLEMTDALRGASDG